MNEDADGKEYVRNVGGRIVPQYQNRGYITEALKAVLDHTTNTLSWFCKAEDLRSQHIAEKLGFAYVKTFAKAQYNLPNDFYYYILEKTPTVFDHCWSLNFLMRSPLSCHFSFAKLYSIFCVIINGVKFGEKVQNCKMNPLRDNLLPKVAEREEFGW